MKKIVAQKQVFLKTPILLLGIISGILVGLVSCTKNSDDMISVNGVSVSAPAGSLIINEALQIEVGEALQLSITVFPEDATNSQMIWTSSDESIATVGETGSVMGIATGTVNITCTSQDNPSISDAITLQVLGTNTIISFDFSGLETVQPIINDTEILFEVDFNNEGKNVDVAALIPAIVHNGASVSPASGATQDFTGGPVAYTVTSTDGIQQIYMVSVKNKPNTAFVTTWQAQNITIPVNTNFTYNYNVDWNNDGFIDQTGITGNVNHDFGFTNAHTIQISGNFPAIRMSGVSDSEKNKLVSLDQWGTIGWLSMENAFFRCRFLQTPATDIPGLSNVASMRSMFEDADSADPDVSNWDTSKITNMRGLFRNADLANPDVSDWDTSLVADMRELFENAANANPDVSSWNISKVTSMSETFRNSRISRTNYENALVRFAEHDEPGNGLFLRNNINLVSVPVQFCSAEAETAKAILNANGWSGIGSKATDCTP